MPDSIKVAGGSATEGSAEAAALKKAYFGQLMNVQRTTHVNFRPRSWVLTVVPTWVLAGLGAACHTALGPVQ